MSDFESGMAESVIVGIGVNISTEKFPEEISGIAGSVGVFAERSRLCADIACRLLDYAEDPSSRGLLEKYRSRSLVLGREVTFRHGTLRFNGNVSEKLLTLLIQELKR
jgi:BirA family biotin operon repressor/biotin-[acetyl-CoA-carboxylase] ligase